MPATLVSAIGRGQKDSSAGRTTYQRCTYFVDGAPQAPTCFFAGAWLASAAGRAVDRVELIGTATSSWSAFAEEYGAAELWEALEARCETQNCEGVRHEDLSPLESLLAERWQRPVRCHILARQAIDDANAGTVLAKLLPLFPLDEPARELQLDTTHGFRTLPLLAVSAVQLADALAPGLAARTRLIYGERLDAASARGFAFDSVLANQRLANAANIFFNTFDGEPLADVLGGRHPAMAKSIRAFSADLQANAFDRLDNRIRQLRNSLRALPDDAPVIVRELARRLETLVGRLTRPDLPRRLRALAQLRAERHQYGHALLTLAEAATALACPAPVDSFEEMKAAGRAFGDTLPKSDRHAWRALFRARNRIAHGANLAPEADTPNAVNIRDHFTRGAALLDKLLA